MKTFLENAMLSTLVLTFLSLGGMALIAVLSHYQRPDTLPDYGRDGLRAGAAVHRAVGASGDPLTIWTHRNDAGPFMNTVLHRAESAGGYLAAEDRQQIGFKPWSYRSLTLMAPAAFIDELDTLRDGAGGHVNANYRRWALDTPPATIAPPVAADLALVEVRVKYRNISTHRLDRSLTALFVTAAVSIVSSVMCGAVLGATQDIARSRAGSGQPESPTPVPAPAAAPSPPPPDRLSRDDLAWRRDGDLIVGAYRDFELELRGVAGRMPADFVVRVNVRRGDQWLYQSSGVSYDDAIARGIAAIHKRLLEDSAPDHARRMADQCFAALTGQPVRDAVAQLVGRGPEVRARYMA